MSYLRIQKKYFFATTIILIGVFATAGIFVFTKSRIGQKGIASAQEIQWTSATGQGISIPACTSAAHDLPTCETGAPKVRLTWIYNGNEGACTESQILFEFAGIPKISGPANSRMAYGVINNKLYIAQGSQLGTAAYAYDPVQNNWTQLASAPHGAMAPPSAVHNGRLFSFDTYSPLRYNPANNSWVAVGDPPPFNPEWGQATTVGGNIYIFNHSNNFRYDVSSGTWLQRANPPRGHGVWPAVTTVNGIIYVIGGDGPSPNAVDAYNPATDSWTQKADIPFPRGYADAISYGNEIYVFGGGTWDNPGKIIFRYNTLTDQWQLTGEMTTARNVPAVGLINGKIYVYGGEYQGAYFGDITEYDLAFAPPSVAGLTCTANSGDEYTATGLQNNTSYNYRIAVLNGSTYLDFSNADSFITPDCSPPPPPANPFGNCPNPGTTATLTWDPSPGATSYKIRVDQNPPSWSGNCAALNPGDICDDNVLTNSYTFNSIQGATYDWWVHATNANGDSTPADGNTFICYLPQPNLVGRPITINGTFSPSGQSLTFSGRIRNIGDANAAASTARFLVDTTTVSNHPTPALAPSTSSSNLTSSSWMSTPGPHTVYLCADVNSQVAESIETDNCSEQTFVIYDKLPIPPPKFIEVKP